MIIKKSNKGFRIEKFSKKDWIAIGKKSGWIKKSQLETESNEDIIARLTKENQELREVISDMTLNIIMDFHADDVDKEYAKEIRNQFGMEKVRGQFGQLV